MPEGQDLLQQIANAGARIDPGLSDREVERMVQGAHRRRRRRTLRRMALLAAGGGMAVMALGVWLGRAPAPSQQLVTSRLEPARKQVADRTLRFAEGSLATPLDVGSEMAVTEQSATRVGVSLSRGRGRFDVTPRPRRSFQVRAGEVTITVIGTVFTVERVADRVGVTVERGSVRVEWGRGARLLRRGESGWFPPLVVEAPSILPEARPAAPRPVRSKPAVAARVSDRAGAPATSSTSAEALLLAADNARLGGHPQQGAELLRRLLREHRDDPRAPLAAFTLGRVLLMELGEPGEAAAAFAEVRRLAPRGSFAEDALAREVEAWSRARRPELARTRAQEYLRRFPGGRRAATVRAMGGLE